MMDSDVVPVSALRPVYVTSIVTAVAHGMHTVTTRLQLYLRRDLYTIIKVATRSSPDAEIARHAHHRMLRRQRALNAGLIM